MGGIDLLVLIAPEIDHAQAVLLALEEIVELVCCRAPAGVGFGDGVSREAAEAVEKDALLGLVEAREGSRSGRGPGPVRGRAAEDGDGGGLVVDEDAALAGGEDFAAQDDVVARGVDAVVFEDGFGVGRGLEDAGDDGLVGAVADDFDGGFAAHQQGQRIDEDGFAGAGFAGEQIETGAEEGDGVIDDGVVFSAQFDEHFVRSRKNKNNRRCFDFGRGGDFRSGWRIYGVLWFPTYRKKRDGWGTMPLLFTEPLLFSGYVVRERQKPR